MIGLYCRLSVADGEHGEESDSIANQRMILADFVTGRADLRGKERRFFVDDGISGTHADNRPALQELLALCREGRCEAVVVKDLSRLSRDDLFCVDLVEDALPSLGVRVIAVADGYDSLRDRDRPSAGTELGFKAIMNSWYSKDLSFKVTQSIRSSQRRGVNLNTVPFGYAKDAEGNCVIDPEGAEVVRRAFDLALSGKSQAQIAKVLNAERMVTPRNLQAKRHPEGKWEVRPGARWSGTMVKSLVTNPHYKGTLVLGKRRSVEVGGRRNRKTGDDERYVFDGAHEGIVTAREWERAQRAMTSGATGGAMPRSNRLFAGRIFCGRCGRAVPYRTDRKDDFWGNPNDTAESGSSANGTKSIFDPCPKGWMVASPTIYKEVLAGKDDAFEKNSSVQSLIYKYDGTNKAYWHFSGLKWASSGGNPNNNQNDILGVWSNSSYHGYEASDHNVYQLYYRTSQGTWNDGGGRAAGMSVRCMQDTENR